MAGAGYKSFNSGDILTASQVNTYLMDQSVMNFATIAARTTALSSPAEGTVTYLADNNRIEVYDGANWRTVYTPTFASAAARNTAFPSPYAGLQTLLTDDGRIEIYDGSVWKILYLPPTSYTPSATNYTRSSGSFVYSVAGHTMTISGSIVVSAVSGAIQVGLPSGFTMSSLVGTTQSVGVARFIVAGGFYHGTARAQSTSSMRLMVFNAAATYVVENDCTNLVPATWASGNSFSVSATFPLA
jgi:hypothetical protein